MRSFLLVVTGLGLCLAPTESAPAAVIGTMTPAEPLSERRIAALPSAEKAPWVAYWSGSQSRMASDKAALAAERRGLATVPAGPPAGNPATMPLDRQATWYGSPEALRIADNIVSFVTPAGGWGKNHDRTGPPRQRGQSYVAADKMPAGVARDIKSDERWAFVGTIDNGATTTELRFLARVQQAFPGARGKPYRAAFLKGTRYLLDAQFPNGGWPQVYPLQGSYHDAVTFNDHAITHVVELLHDVAARRGDYAFLPDLLAGEARTAVDRATAMILRAQVVAGGRRTGWGQQHDVLTLAPVGARNFEPASLSSYESAALLSLLMRLPSPSPEVVRAVHDGVAWLEARALRNIEWTDVGSGGRRLVPKPGAGPLWARFYDIGTMRPIFGDRDKSIHDDVNELSAERRDGYSWFGTSPARTLRLYQSWTKSRPRARDPNG